MLRATRGPWPPPNRNPNQPGEEGAGEEGEEGEGEEQSYTLTGQGKFDLGTFWAHHVNGDTMKLSLRCDEVDDKESALSEIDQFAG